MQIEKQIRDLARDEELKQALHRMILETFRPIREETGRDFDLRLTTQFVLPDRMPQRLESLVENVATEVAKRLLPVMQKEADSEARHQLIRKLAEVMA